MVDETSPLAATVGEVNVVDAVLALRILLDGLVTYLALLPPFFRSAEAMRVATAVYSHSDCLFTHATATRTSA